MSCDCSTKLLNLDSIKDEYAKDAKGVQRRVILCAGTGCMANGSMKLFHALEAEIKKAGLNVVVELHKEDKPEKFIHLSKSGCQGFCQMGPLLSILPDKVLYCQSKVEDIPEIVEKTLVNNEIIDRLLYVDPNTKKHCKGQDEIPFYTLQNRTVLSNCAVLDPNDIREYISRNGYRSAEKVWKTMTPEETCNLMLASGLKGRGGAGFPTGRKWNFARVEPGSKKYVICNGDEGDPGAFMDRSVMEGDPHAVLEGMMIASHAIGADEGWIYVRMEYPLAVERMRNAIKAAEEIGILGDNVFGTGRKFHVNIMEGAGAFVCGEETALIASIEGNRGMPSPKPPFPAKSGLWGKPTVINNVETLAIIPTIFQKGPEWYSSMGTETAKGTKTFALTGHVANTGLIEVPFGTTLRKILLDIGGGVVDNKGKLTGLDGFKVVQIGGPSGGCLTSEHLDVPIDYATLSKYGAIVGSGGLVVMNKDSCMVSVARFFMQFTQNESCGKCVPCREGTKAMLNLLDEIIAGNGTEKTLDELEELALAVSKASLCALGKTAPNPVLSTLKYFRDEYLAHVRDKHCPTGNCKALAKPEILADRCKGCTLCAKKCPVNAITGEPKKPHKIDITKCIKCGECARNCRFDAIIGVN